MRAFQGTKYPANVITYYFDDLFGVKRGSRGNAWDAATWRRGSQQSMGNVLNQTIAKIEERAKGLSGSASASLNGPLSMLKSVGAEMAKQGDEPVEQSDYHWMIVGSLVGMISALLDALGV